MLQSGTKGGLGRYKVTYQLYCNPHPPACPSILSLQAWSAFSPVKLHNLQDKHLIRSILTTSNATQLGCRTGGGDLQGSRGRFGPSLTPSILSVTSLSIPPNELMHDHVRTNKRCRAAELEKGRRRASLVSPLDRIRRLLPLRLPHRPARRLPCGHQECQRSDPPGTSLSLTTIAVRTDSKSDPCTL